MEKIKLKKKRRRHFFIANPNSDDAISKERIGLAVLSALSISGIHSAVNPSFFTLRAFAKKPVERSNAITGLWIGLGLGLAGSVAIYLVFDEILPALVAGGTALGLFAIGIAAVQSNGGPEEPTMAPAPMVPRETFP